MGPALMENRHGPAVDGPASPAEGQAERLAGEVMLMRREEGERATAVAWPTLTSYWEAAPSERTVWTVERKGVGERIMTV